MSSANGPVKARQDLLDALVSTESASERYRHALANQGPEAIVNAALSLMANLIHAQRTLAAYRP